MSLIPALKRLSQKHLCEFEDSQDYTEICLEKKKKSEKELASSCLALRKLSQKHLCEFKTSLSYRVRPYL